MFNRGDHLPGFLGQHMGGDWSAVSTGGLDYPLQDETAAYFARFSTAPSPLYLNALNTAIYQWKANQTWTVIRDLYLFMADTSADAVRNVIAPTRNATLAGSPPFVTNVGFGPLSSTATVSMPINLSGLTAGNNYYFFCGRLNVAPAASTQAMGTSGVEGNVQTNTSTMWRMGNTASMISPGSTGSPPFYIFAYRGAVIVFPTGVVSQSGSSATLPSGAIAANTTWVTQLTAYGVIEPAMGNQHMARFLNILNDLCQTMGAGP